MAFQQVSRILFRVTCFLQEDYFLSFKRIFGAGYVATFQKSFDTIDETITEAKSNVRHRNLGKSKTDYFIVG